MNTLSKKYNRQGPRYTSYPPVPFWKDVPDEKSWVTHLVLNYDPLKGVDLYVHIPFCEKLCYYCACNRVITKNHKLEEEYVDLLLREWELYTSQLGFTPVVNSLHFGGGTPTFLSPGNLERLLVTLTQSRAPEFTGSIEVDPRNVSPEHLDMLSRNGVTRISLGIQDFDPDVQKAINRSQSFELVENLMREIRKRNFDSVNFDIIYGLPLQTAGTIERTLKQVTALKPDLIAFYSYAHLPERISNQRLIKTEDLPQNQEKLYLYDAGKSALSRSGYVDIGMDHFSLPENFLSRAKNDRALDRNFMGYVDRKSNILIGLGASAISNSSVSFIQNSKNISDYRNKINSSALAIESGHTHTDDDLITQKLILDIMCSDEFSVDLAKYPYREDIQRELEEFEADQLIKKVGNRISILPDGKKFIRNIAMIFDFHFREKMYAGFFSKTV